MKRSLFCLTAHDYDCIDFIVTTHAHIRRADAVRFAIQEQDRRSSWPGAVHKAKALADECKEMGATNPERRPLKRWHMLLSPALDEMLESIQRRHEFQHKAEAVRFIVRSQAYSDGFRPGGVMIKPPAPTKRPRKKAAVSAE